MEQRKERSKNVKKRTNFTFLVHKNQFPFFFLCSKYGPEVNTTSREYDKRVQQSFLFETRWVSSTEGRELLNQNLSKNESLNLFIASRDNLIHISYLQEPVVPIYSGRKVQTRVVKTELSQSAIVSKSLWAFISKSERQNVGWKERSQDKSTGNSSHSGNRNFNMYFQRIILKLAKDDFQIHPVQPSFQRGQREITPQSCAGSGYNWKCVRPLNSLLLQLCNGSFFSILLYAISAIKRTWEGTYIIIYVRWEIGEQNISTFSRVWECRSVSELNIQIAWTIGRNDPCRRLFQVQPHPPPPLPLGFPEPLTLLPQEFPESHLSGGVDFFWNNLMWKIPTFFLMSLWLSSAPYF